MKNAGYSIAVPKEYKSESSKPGTVIKEEYMSKDYAGNKKEVSKEAYVYIPYGYDENDEGTKYDILYLMHGWGGYAGDYFEYSSLKNVLDNMIEKGDISPTIDNARGNDYRFVVIRVKNK